MTEVFTAKADTQIELADFLQLTDDERDTLVASLQERRMGAYKVYEELVKEKKEAKHAKIREQIERMCELFEKDLARADKALAKVEERVRKIRIMRMELDQ